MVRPFRPLALGSSDGCTVQGIVPTLIVVRVGLGISTQDVTSYATTALNATRSGPTFALPMRFRHNEDMDTSTATYELDSRSTVPVAGGDKARGLDSASK